MSEVKIDKTSFEKIINQRANNVYNDKRKELDELLNRYFQQNPFMNNNTTGSSTTYLLNPHIDGIFKLKKEDIIKAIEKIEMNKILNNLNDVRFLFEDQNYDR